MPRRQEFETQRRAEARRPKLKKMEEKVQGGGHKKAHFIHSGWTHTHMVSESPWDSYGSHSQGPLTPGKLAQSGQGPPLCFHTCLQKQLLRQIQGTEGQTDVQEEEVALQTHRDRKERDC